MKYLILFVVIAVVLWLARGKRPLPPPGRTAEPQPDTMVACAQCGLHLPRSEALPGRGGMFCGEAHRAQYERAHPPA